jgi:hypothetical protein
MLSANQYPSIYYLSKREKNQGSQNTAIPLYRMFIIFEMNAAVLSYSLSVSASWMQYGYLCEAYERFSIGRRRLRLGKSIIRCGDKDDIRMLYLSDV